MTTGGVSAQDKAARDSVANIKGGLEAYRDVNGRWPASMSALQSYASQRGRAIDLSPFSKMTLTLRSSDTVLVEFVTLPPASQKGGFALSRIDVP